MSNRRFKIGDGVTVVKNDDGTNNYVGITSVIDGVNDAFTASHPYTLAATGSTGFGEHELQLANDKLKGETMKKATYYKVLKDVPAWKAGAIIKKEDGEKNYEAINDLWDNVEDLGEYVEVARVVEHSPDFFERVYAMGKASKMLFLTKEKAQEMASKFFTEE